MEVSGPDQGLTVVSCQLPIAGEGSATDPIGGMDPHERG